MSMKPWERAIIAYRPDIGLKRTILSIVQKRTGGTVDAHSGEYVPSGVVDRAAAILGSDVIDHLMASLSQATDLLRETESALARNPRFQRYKDALAAGNDALARQIHHENLEDIGGEPELDVYPILRDALPELEAFLDFLNDELFNGTLDYEDPAAARLAEEQKIEAIVAAEAEDTAPITLEDLTDQQASVIEDLMLQTEMGAVSKTDYLSYLNDERRAIGSPRVDYDDLTGRVQFIAAVMEKAKTFESLFGQVRIYLNQRLSTHLRNDVDGSLNFMRDLKYPTDEVVDGNQRKLDDKKRRDELRKQGIRVSDAPLSFDTRSVLDRLKDVFEDNFRWHSNQVKNDYVHQRRVANAEIRTYLDKKLAHVRRKRQSASSLVARLRKGGESTGGQLIFYDAKDAFDIIDATWKFVMTEHISATEMNRDQQTRLFTDLAAMQKNRSITRYVDIVDRELEGNTKADTDRLIKTHSLYTRR